MRFEAMKNERKVIHENIKLLIGSKTIENVHEEQHEEHL
jgi:hypothetical protein